MVVKSEKTDCRAGARNDNPLSSRAQHGDLVTASDSNQLVYSPHPLLIESNRVYEAMAWHHDENLQQFLDRSPADTRLPLQVMLNDCIIPRDQWATTLVKPGSVVNVRAMVQGGDGSDPLQTLLTIAVLVASQNPELALSVGKTFGGGQILGGVLISVGGMYLVSQLLKPPTPIDREQESSPTYSLTGGSNRLRPYQPLPLVIGTHRIYPDLGAKPFTHLEGEDQYLNQIFNFGLSNLVLSDFKIGDTPLTSFNDYILEEAHPEGHIYNFPGNVDTLAGSELTLGNWVQLTSSVDTTRITVALSGLIFYSGDRGLEQLRVTVDMQYRAVGSPTWVDFPAPSGRQWGASPYVIDHGSSEPWRMARFVGLLPAAQYEVRVRFTSLTRRFTTQVWVVPPGEDPENGHYEQVISYPPVDINHQRVTAKLNWDQLQSVQPDLGDYIEQKRYSLEIRASGQLNGVIDAFNALGSAICDAWSGSAWVSSQNSNPAWWFRYVAKGKFDVNGRRLFGGGYSDAQIDEDVIKAWGAWCDLKGLSVNLVFDTAKNVADMLDIIARCGRARKSWGSGKLGVVYDQENLPVTAVFGMANIIAGSFQVAYASGQLPDEIVLNWINPAIGYQQDTVRKTVPGVTNPVNPVTVEIPGITNEVQAGKECNLIAAQQAHRVRTITWETDLEGRGVSTGNVAALSHDLTQWGQSGRLVSGTVNNLVLDRPVTFTPAETHWIGIRYPDGSYGHYQVAIQTGESDSLTLIDPLPSAPDDDPDNPVIDYIWMFEPKATPGKKVKITDIKPVSEHRVRLSATDETDAYYLAENDAYTYVVPDNYSVSVPTISNLTINTTLINAGSGFAVRIALAWDIEGEYGGAFVRAAFNDEVFKDKGRTLDRYITFDGPEQGKVTVLVGAFNKQGQFGPGSAINGSLVYVGNDQPPADATGLTISYLSDNTRQLLPIIAELPAAFAGCVYRARSGSHATWDDLSIANGGLDLHDKPIKELPWETVQIPSGLHTVGVKLIDIYSNESVNGFLTEVNFPAQPTVYSRTYAQPTAPTIDLLVGDIWIDTDAGNLMHRWDGSVWDELQDDDILQALLDAATAQSTADGKIETYYQAAMPAGSEGDLWIDTDDGNRQYRHNGTTFVGVQDADINTALLVANTAQSAADNAQATADNKITTYYQTNTPATPDAGDLWFNENTGLLKRWTGSQWQDTADETTKSETHSHTVYFYQVATSQPATPSASAGSYNFLTKVLVPPTNWSITPPPSSGNLWVAETTFSCVGSPGPDNVINTYETPFTSQENNATENAPDIGFQIVTAVYNGKNFDVGTEDSNPRSITFSSDGLKMYIAGTSSDRIYEYNLSTPYHVITAELNQSYDHSAQSTLVNAFRFSADGTRFFILDAFEVVYQYDLSTAWDVSTAAYNSVSKNVISESSQFLSMEFSTDGLNMYLLEGTGAAPWEIYQYNLSTAWDLSTATYTAGNKLSASANPNGTTHIPWQHEFNGDGTVLVITVTNSGWLYQWDLSTPWDITTAVYSGNSINLTEISSGIRCFAYEPKGFKMYASQGFSVGGAVIYQYALDIH